MTSRFRFRLQPVLDHRGRIVDDCQRELAVRIRALGEAETIAAGLQADRAAQRDALMRDHAGFDINRLRATYARLAYLDRAIDLAAGQVAAAAGDVAQAQDRLIGADTDRRVIETLKTRRHEAFVAEAALLEQRDGDDQNARRHGRSQSGKERHHE